MKTRYSLTWLSLMVLMLTGCFPNLPQPVKTTLPAKLESTKTQESATPTQNNLATDAIRNAEYLLGDGSTKVRLVDGAYEESSGVVTTRVSLLDKLVFADLDGDDKKDAAVILVENYGGTGQFEYLIPVMNVDGNASPQQGYFLGDRVAVNAIIFEGNRIVMDMLIHGPNDGLCCPSMPMKRSFEYYPGFGFRLVHITTGTDDSTFRDITLSEPVSGDVISNQFQVSGSFTISPFEATLVIRVMDVNDQVIYQGSIMAPVANLGDPGTFSDMVDMSGANPSPGLVRIEVYETSMADGTTLVMDSVLVILE
jgi:hypothetical protein